MEPTSHSRRPTGWRRLLAHPIVWAAAGTAAALPFFIPGRGLDFVPFILGLLAGWLCGIAFVNATSRARTRWHGVVAHVVGALLGTLFLVWSLGQGASALASTPDIVRGVVLLAQVGALPGVCWTWVGLLGRGIAALPSSGGTSPR